uniref:Calcineurin-like phosphoesterase domain-containing protein n=2 Tax=Triticum aestivum TaxID=4565 RepID=A0A3B6TM34_WHEAT
MATSGAGAGAGRVRLAVVGDVHDDWILDEDTKALHFLQPDLVLFTGDYGNENVQLVKSISDLQFPKAAILGNHDCWRTHQFSEKKVDRVRLQLERYGVDDMSGSVRKIYDAATAAPEEHSVILLAHNGPTGLGSRIDDICGRDWVAGGGDHGDPDLEQAISDLQRETGVSIPLVVFGHMHKSLAYGGGLRKMIAFGANNQTIYLNGAVVPRVKPAEAMSPSTISTSERDELQESASVGPMSRAFTTVDLFDGTVEKISEVWVLVSGAQAELEEETVLYKRPREHM